MVNKLREETTKYLSMILSSEEGITEYQKQTVIGSIPRNQMILKHMGDYAKYSRPCSEKDKNKYVLSDGAYKEVYFYFGLIR